MFRPIFAHFYGVLPAAEAFKVMDANKDGVIKGAEMMGVKKSGLFHMPIFPREFGMQKDLFIKRNSKLAVRATQPASLNPFLVVLFMASSGYNIDREVYLACFFVHF